MNARRRTTGNGRGFKLAFGWLAALVLTAACSTPATTETPAADVADTLAADVTATTDIAGDSTEVAAACPGGDGCACATDAECATKHCLADEAGVKTCARSCSSDLCPVGFGCGTLDGKSLCIPRRVNLCEPCLKDSAECEITGLPGAACVKYGNLGAFCGAACTSDGDCGTGFACRSVERIEGGTAQQCVRVDTGGALSECACSQRAIDAQKTTLCGVTGGAHTCAGVRTCGASGLSLCDALTPTTETCDGVDNDCNGATDEGTCNDSNPCTDDSCGGAAGCSNPSNTAECSDGNACTLNDACADGTCVGTVDACDDANLCTDDSCDKFKGCAHKSNTATCDDGDLCTLSDLCKGGVCLPGEVTVCDDGVACTADACTGTGCIFTPATGGICSDNDACTAADACLDGACKGTAISCDDANPCSDDSCTPSKGCVHVDGAGTCDDGNPCTDSDTCAGGACVGTAKTCTSLGVCLTAACSAIAGGCSYVQKPEGTACSDGDACTSDDACVSGDCAGNATNCADGNACTEDSCSQVSGCGHVALTGACDDGNSCTQNDTCATGTCVGVALDCDDGKPCTDDTCTAGGGCKHTNHVGSCDDGKPCTSGDVCTGSVCAGPTATDCADADPCTDDSCDVATGCKHAPNSTGLCDLDNSKCTPDKCSSGVCAAGVAKVCDDGLSCTTDACSATTGDCVFTPVTNGTACDDANNCTSPDTCQAGACVGNLPGTAVTTYAGQGSAGGKDDANSQLATFNQPRSLALDAGGALYVADTGGFKIRKIAVDGTVSTWAGQGISGYLEGTGTVARFSYPEAVVVAGTDLYVSDSRVQNIRKIAADQSTSLIAGSNVEPSGPGFPNPGDFQDGPASGALFSSPTGLAWNATTSTLYVADRGNNRIRAIDIAGSTVSTLVGTGAAGQNDGPLIGATLNQPTGLFLSSDGSKLYVTDQGSNVVRLIDLVANTVSTIAGIGSVGNADGANMTVASFSTPWGITGDGTTLWLADKGNHRLRTINATATSTLTGSTSTPFANGTFSLATFNQPSGILWVSTGVWYVADTGNHRIRKLVDPNAGCVP